MCINVNTHICTYMEINKNLKTLRSFPEPLWDSACVSQEVAQKQQEKEMWNFSGPLQCLTSNRKK